MHRKRMAQALRRDALVQNSEVHRVKRRIAQPRQRRGQQQAVVALRHARRHASQGKAQQRRKQNRPRAHPIDHKARQRLADARDDKKHRHQQPQL